LTEDKTTGKLGLTVVDDYQKVTSNLLKPLAEGKPVVLKVNDPFLYRKRRLSTPILVMVEIPDTGILLVSLPAYGSELIDLTKAVKVSTMLRLGLNARLSRALVDALNTFYGGHKDGTATSTTQQRSSRS
jgi:hypothetical protein